MDFEDIDDDVLNEFIDNAPPFIDKNDDTEKTPVNSLQPGPEHLEVLSKYFGHTNFRPMQWDIISSIIHNQRDVCAIMSTGYGKSLCFQFPSTFLGGVTLVISPLIALMEDQVLSLQVSNIPACLLGTAQKNQKQVVEDILKSKYNLVYLTPEFCCGDYGTDVLKKMAKEISVVLIAIDEAHCISSWGHDFRSQYRQLCVLRNIFSQVPIIAVTATATPTVREDIIKSLKLRNPLTVCSGFDRPNLYFEVHLKSCHGIYKDLTRAMVHENSSYKFSGPTIIYCITRKETEEVDQILRINGIKCLPYHAGLSLSARQEAHEQFLKDKVDVIVATIAFGMGIDKPDIRNVVHYGASKSVESYYQEVGRAGRDGLPAKCVTIYNRSDFKIHRSLNSQTYGHEEQKEARLKKIDSYLTTLKCRRRFILEHFEDRIDHLSKPRNDCCDNCNKMLCDSRTDQEKYEGIDSNGCYDFTDDARLLLKVFSLFNADKFGLGTYVSFLRGLKSSKFAESKRQNPLYGSGKEKPETWWQAIAKLLVEEKYLYEKTEKASQRFTYVATVLTDKGRTMARSNDKLVRSPPSYIVRLLKTKPSKDPTWLSTRPTNVQPTTSKETVTENAETQAEIDERMALYRKLLDQRGDLASELDCMPYTVASNAALMSMSKFKPKTLDELRRLNLDGFTEAKINKFGDKFLRIIVGNVNAETGKKLTIKDILIKHPIPDVFIGLTAQVSCTMFQSGLTVGEIAEKRGVSPRTVVSHLISGMKFGQPIKMIELDVTEECRDAIITIFRRHCKTGFATVKLKLIMDECPPEITYDHINVVLAYLQVRHHLQMLNIPYEEFEDFHFEDVKMDSDEMKNCESEIAATQNWNEIYGNKENEDLDPAVEEALNKFESPAKKLKTDNDLIQPKTDFDNIILDSLPRQVSTTPTPHNTQPEVANEELCCSTSSAHSSNKNSKKKVLPPWLVRKKIN